MNSMFEKRRGICTNCTEFGATFSKIALKTVQNFKILHCFWCNITACHAFVVFRIDVLKWVTCANLWLAFWKREKWQNPIPPFSKIVINLCYRGILLLKQNVDF